MTQARRLAVVLALNLALVVALAVVGLVVGSVSLLATAGDSLGDAFALALGLLAVHLRDRHGRAGATNVVALVNVVILLGVCAAVIVGAVLRLVQGSPEVPGLPILVAALGTVVVLGTGVLVLGRGAGSEDLHMRSVLLDTASDAGAAAAVAVSGAIIAAAHGLFWLDPVVAGVIAVAIAVGAVRLLRDVVTALRRGAVVEVDLD
ncbi:cation diffusion facilitator family transporter [Amnibacterium sp. CER49]|uniref:cation diffusion facilitator family transporter n=1 Tax=Amnibacterium sp. CER49 TaxID=3039161 RepID=UPI00244AEF39|nr:cation diffusion facilitator family transporter [Amnibacterium sp. CER49]MDH2442627.1 cation diffusion facilitator family transporter [Amnibacterium sp. CER49]